MVGVHYAVQITILHTYGVVLKLNEVRISLKPVCVSLHPNARIVSINSNFGLDDHRNILLEEF